MARTKSKPIKVNATVIDNPIEQLTNKVLKEHTQAIYDLALGIRQNQYAIAYHLHEISVADCVKDDGFADVFEFAAKMFGFEKNYTYKYINLWTHFGLKNADTGETSSLFLTDGKDFNISNLIELNQFDKWQVKALMDAGIISVDSTQKTIREVRKAIKDGLIVFNETTKSAAYVKPTNTDTGEAETTGKVDTNTDSNESSTGDTDNSLADVGSVDGSNNTVDNGRVTIDDVNSWGKSIFKDFDDVLAANEHTYDDTDLYNALIRVETSLAALANMDAFKLNHVQIHKRVVSVGKALDGIRRVLVDDEEKGNN